MPLIRKINKIRFSGYYERITLRLYIFLFAGFFFGMAYNLSMMDDYIREEQQERLTEEIKLFKYAQNHTFPEYYAKKYGTSLIPEIPIKKEKLNKRILTPFK